MVYIGGQPVMDQGLENMAMISLFTGQGWCGNLYLDPDEQIGSDFEATCRKSVTLQSITADIPNAADRALKSDYFPERVIAVTNPRSDWLHLAITLGPGNTITLDKRGMNWLAQAAYAANVRTGGV
jgi:phage gp46-like protein